MHVAEVYELRKGDPTHKRWHSKHIERKTLYSSAVALEKRAAEKGTAGSAKIGLCMLALHHSTCFPTKHRLKKGVYDVMGLANSANVEEQSVSRLVNSQ